LRFNLFKLHFAHTHCLSNFSDIMTWILIIQNTYLIPRVNLILIFEIPINSFFPQQPFTSIHFYGIQTSHTSHLIISYCCSHIVKHRFSFSHSTFSSIIIKVIFKVVNIIFILRLIGFDYSDWLHIRIHIWMSIIKIFFCFCEMQGLEGLILINCFSIDIVLGKWTLSRIGVVTLDFILVNFVFVKWVGVIHRFAKSVRFLFRLH